MNYYEILNLSFTHIQIFLCAAETNSFTEAAKRLNFTHSMISKTISSLAPMYAGYWLPPFVTRASER